MAQMVLGEDGIVEARFVTFDTSQQANEYQAQFFAEGEDDGKAGEYEAGVRGELAGGQRGDLAGAGAAGVGEESGRGGEALRGDVSGGESGATAAGGRTDEGRGGA